MSAPLDDEALWTAFTTSTLPEPMWTHESHLRIAFLHLKDVEPSANHDGYRFVELGRGRVNFDAVFSALNQIGFNGWGVVELDETEPGRTARESAEINRKYLETRGFRIA